MRSIRRVLGAGSPICVVLLTVLLSGCGGSGGGDGGGNVHKFATSGIVDSTTAAKIVSGLGNIITGTNAAVNPVGRQVASGIYCPKSLIQHGLDTVFYSGHGLKTSSDSGGDFKVVFGSDGSVSITSGGQTLGYESCESLPPCI